MALWLPRQWPGAGHQLWWSPQLESSPQLEVWAMMIPECEFEVVAEVPNAAESNEG